MRTYTEQELLKAIHYACSYQKAEDYQTAGKHLLSPEKDWEGAREDLLNELYDVENNSAGDITIQDIQEYLEEGRND